MAKRYRNHAARRDRALQLKKLQHTVKWSYDRVPYYHKIMEEAGVTPDQIRSLDDVRRLPFTTKADLRDNYPFGLFAVPKKDIVEIHASSGTTGKPIVGGYTRHDLDVWSDCVARLAVAAGATSDDISQIAFAMDCLPALSDCITLWKKSALWSYRFLVETVKSRLC